MMKSLSGKVRSPVRGNSPILDSWRKGETLVLRVSHEDFLNRQKDHDDTWGLERLRPMPDGDEEWVFTYLLLQHGFVAFIEREPTEEYLTIVQELTQALSLDYVWHLDFQRLEEQNNALARNPRLLRETPTSSFFRRRWPR